MKKMYIVTGAAGHLGSTIIKMLSKEDCVVRGLILQNEKPVNYDNVKYYIGDICDIQSLHVLFEEIEDREVIVIHSAGIISLLEEVTPLIFNVNVNGTKNMLSLCKEKNVQKLVYISSVDAIPARDKLVTIKEIKEFSLDNVDGGYAKTKAEASQMVLDAAKEGLNAVVLHPSAIIGPYDLTGKNHVVNQVSDYINGKMPAYVEGTFDFVDVRDVAKGCLQACEKGRSGETYILSNSRYTFKEFLYTIKEANGGNGKAIPKLPMGFVMKIAPIMEWSGKKNGKTPLFSKYTLRKLTGNSRFSHDKATRELGYIPRDLLESVNDTVAWLKTVNE